MTAAQRSKIPVIVVGAGPVGLALGNELGWRGIGCKLVERSTELVDFPTCESINARTLEHMRRWGMADAMRDAGFPPDMPRSVRFMTRVLGYELLCFERPSNRDFQQTLGHVTPEGGIWCPRMLFEPVMHRHLTHYPQVQLAAGHEVTRFAQDDDGVDVDLQDLRTGQMTYWRCDYLVACDGAASGTRKALGIALAGTFAEGHNITLYFESVALAARLTDKPGVMMDIVNAEGRANLSSVDGRARWRLTVHAMPHEAVDPERRIREALGQQLDFTVIGAKPWDGHRVVAQRYRDRRVFLAGDAAHLLWPRGGFGMNTGVGDVVDLGWKLEAMLAGWGGARLLDSYELERRPVATRNVDEAASNRAEDAGLPVPADIEDDTPAGAQARHRLAEVIRERRAKEWNSLGIQLGYTYGDSPLCVSDGTPALPQSATDYVPNTRPGARAPHGWLEDGRSTLDLFGRGFVLLTFGVTQDMVAGLLSAALERKVPLQTVAIEDVAIAQLYERRLVLVRPDGHVAWRSDQAPRDAGAVIDQIRGSRLTAA
ncbi:MAG: FAD-dependent monooxygenase [Betaproteobacteria bacterium]